MTTSREVSPSGADYADAEDQPEVRQQAESTENVQLQPIQQLQADVADIRDKKRDYYDSVADRKAYLPLGLSMMSTGLSASVTGVTLALNDIGQEQAGYVVPVAMLLAVTSAPMVGIGSDLKGYTRQREQVPVLAGHGIENLRVTDGRDSMARGDIAMLALPAAGRELTGHEAGEIIHAAQLAGVESVVLPADLPGVRDAADHTVRPLADIISDIKGRGVTVPEPLAQTPYAVLSKDAIQEFGNGQLTTLLGLLVARAPSMVTRTELPTTSEEVRQLAGQLRPLALRGIEDHLETETYMHRDEDGVLERRRQHSYVIPARNDDPFEPAVWRHYVGNERGLPSERYGAGSFAGQPAEIAAIAASGELPSAQVLPVVSHVYRALRLLDEKYRLEEGLSRETPADLPRTVPRGLDLVRPVAEHPRWRRSVAKCLGGTALGGAAVAGVFAAAVLLIGGQAKDAPDPVSLPASTSGVGAAIPGDASPSWRVEGHGMSAAGYYAETDYYELSPGLQWTRPESQLQTKVPPTTYMEGRPHVLVEGLIPVEAGDKVKLPILMNTEVAAVSASSPDGDRLAVRIGEADDGTTVLGFNDERESTAYVRYELAPETDSNPVDGRISVGGMQPGANDPEYAKRSVYDYALHVQNDHMYDNTERLAKMVEAAEGPEDLLYDTMRKRIDNCNVAAANLAVLQFMLDATTEMAMTTGYQIDEGERYMDTPHAWNTFDDGTIDSTPGLKGRSPEEAGLPQPSEADRDRAWNGQVEGYLNEKSDSPDIPWSKLPAAGFAALALASAISRVRQPLWANRLRRAGRYLSAAQSERIIGNYAFGDPQQSPDLDGVTERLSLHSLPREAALQAFHEPARVAPYLSRRQRRSLRRHAALLLDEHAFK